jgi:hypothetical protein
MKRLLASEDGASFRELSTSAQLLYITGLLICNNAGVINKDRLDEAAKDADVRYVAMIIAGRVGLLGQRATLDRYA